MIDKRDVQEFFDRLAPDWDAGMVRNEAVIARILDNACLLYTSDAADE